MRKISFDYSQYESNNTVAFAIASMRFEVSGRIEVRRRRPRDFPEILSMGYPERILSECGHLKITRSFISSQGRLIIEVE